jgi:hypothetical protein
MAPQGRPDDTPRPANKSRGKVGIPCLSNAVDQLNLSQKFLVVPVLQNAATRKEEAGSVSSDARVVSADRDGLGYRVCHALLVLNAVQRKPTCVNAMAGCTLFDTCVRLPCIIAVHIALNTAQQSAQVLYLQQVSTLAHRLLCVLPNELAGMARTRRAVNCRYN